MLKIDLGEGMDTMEFSEAESNAQDLMYVHHLLSLELPLTIRSLLLNKACMRRGSIAFFGHGPQQGESSSRTTRRGKIAIIFVQA